MTFEEIRINNKVGTWKSYTSSDTDSISKTPGVYVFEKKGCVIYIGCSQNLYKRIIYHDKVFLQKGVVVYTIECKCKKSALQLEKRMLGYFQPERNGVYGRVPLPEKERKVRIYILVKKKHASRAQKQLDAVKKFWEAQP